MKQKREKDLHGHSAKVITRPSTPSINNLFQSKARCPKKETIYVWDNKLQTIEKTYAKAYNCMS